MKCTAVGQSDLSDALGALFLADDHNPVLCNRAIEDVWMLDQRPKRILILRGLRQLEEQVSRQRAEEKECDVLVETEANLEPDAHAQHQK
jgi:hypothetical protein